MEVDPLHFRVAFDMPPDDAITYLKSKGYAITSSWDDLSQMAHNRAFTVAGLFRADLILAMQESLAVAMGEGRSLDEWKKNITEELTAKGLYNVEELTTEQGAKQTAVVESHRLENIFRTNTLSALNAGRQLRQDALGDARPWILINFVNDNRQSPTCRKLSQTMKGYVIRYDHPEVAKLTPPFHFRCRDTNSRLSERERVRDGLKIWKGAIEWEPSPGFEGSPVDGFTPDLSKYPDSLRKQFADYLKKREANR